MTERAYGVPFVDPCLIVVSQAAIDSLPADVARADNVAPVGITGNVLIVAVADPLDFDLLDKLRFYCRMPIELVAADADRIRMAVKWHYGGTPAGEL